jgi:hypothetical protein
MNEHALLIPTSVGPVGGIVHEPEGPRVGAIVLLQGLGPAARAGVNALYTRIARDLARLGLVVLRFDFACEGDSTLAGAEVEEDIGWRRSTDLAILRELVPWFLDCIDESEVMLAGSCHGGRVALEFAAFDPAVRGLFLVVPYLWLREPHLGRDPSDDEPPGLQPVWANGPTLNSDEDILAGFRAALAQGLVWVLIGEGEEEHLLPFARRLESDGGPVFELEAVRGLPLHPVGSPQQQEEVMRHLPKRVAHALAERSEAASAP